MTDNLLRDALMRASNGIGPHRVCCASIDSPEVDKMLAGVDVEILYVNPPWTPEIQRNWNNYRMMNTGEPPPALSYDNMIHRIVRLASTVYGYVFVEMDMEWSWLVSSLLNVHFPCVDVFNTKSRPEGVDIVVAGRRPFPGNLTGIYGRELEDLAIGTVARPGAIVFDPMCGYGLTAHAALRHGMRFFGNEYNEARLYHAIRFLERSTNNEAADPSHSLSADR